MAFLYQGSFVDCPAQSATVSFEMGSWTFFDSDQTSYFPTIITDAIYTYAHTYVSSSSSEKANFTSAWAGPDTAAWVEQESSYSNTHYTAATNTESGDDGVNGTTHSFYSGFSSGVNGPIIVSVISAVSASEDYANTGSNGNAQSGSHLYVTSESVYSSSVGETENYWAKYENLIYYAYGFTDTVGGGSRNTVNYTVMNSAHTLIDIGGTSATATYIYSSKETAITWNSTTTGSSSFTDTIVGQTGGAATPTANTATLGLMNGFSFVDGYQSSTSSGVITSYFSGGTLGGKVSYTTYSNAPITLINAAGTTTGYSSATATSSNLIASQSFSATTTITRSQTVNSLSIGLTLTQTTTQTASQTITTATSRSATAGEEITAGQTFYLFKSPTVTQNKGFTQDAYIVADTFIGEFIWNCTANSAFFGQGTTTTSSHFTGEGYSSYSTQASVKLLNSTAAWGTEGITATVGYGTTNSTYATTTSQASSILGPLSVSVLNGTGTGTIFQTFDRTLTTKTESFLIGDSTTSYTTSSDSLYTVSYETERTTNTSGGHHIRWDSTASLFTTFTHNLLTTVSALATSLSNRSLYRHDTHSTTSGNSSSSMASQRGSSITLGYQEYQSTIPFGSGGLKVSFTPIVAAGPRAQLPSALGFSANEGLDYGGAELFYSTKNADGLTLRTPLVFPTTSSISNGISSSTYSYNNTYNGVRGTSQTASTASSTFQSSFSQTTTNRVAGTESHLSSGVVDKPVLGNNEQWTSVKGASTVGWGAMRATTEAGNVTGTTRSYNAYDLEGVIGEQQTAFEADWAARRTTASYQQLIYPRIVTLITSYSSFTS